jgi:hypothetical protein
MRYGLAYSPSRLRSVLAWRRSSCSRRRHAAREFCDMMTRTTRKTVTFFHPFTLKGVDRTLPPGEYQTVMDEELIDGLSFPV